MVNVRDYTETHIVNEFRGLDLRSNKDYLPIGKTSRGKNFQINTPLTLKKKQGVTSLFASEQFPEIAFRAADFYYDEREIPYYLGVSYPHIHLVSPCSGFARPIYSNLGGIGEGQLIKGGIAEALWVDQGNKPVHIQNGVATQVSWPPAYVNNNKEVLNMANATADNPTTFGVDIGMPSLGVYFKGRWILAGDPLAPDRIYASKLRSTDFSDNSTDIDRRVNIAFFVDLFSNSPIVGMKVINDKYLIIFCRNEIFLWTGTYAPTAVSPQPHIKIEPLNSDVGCVGRYAFAEKGDNDIFFISNRQSLYTLSSTDNFQDVRPYGLSGAVYPAFQEISLDRMSRARLVNDNIRGELQLWFPDNDKQYYPNKRFIYNYFQNPNEAEWGEDTGFPLSLRGAFLDKSNNKLILVDREKLLEDGVGTTYDGELIDMIYELAPQDFGDRDSLKEISNIEVAFSIDVTEDNPETEASILLEHLWDDGIESGLTERTLTVRNRYLYDDVGTIIGTATYESGAGTPIYTVSFEILNNKGRVLKAALRSQSSADLTIIDVKFRFRRIGKSTV